MIITHYDTDGKVCLVLARKYMNGIGSYAICDYSNVNEVVNDYLNTVEKYRNDDLVLVLTDIAISAETAHRIDSMKHLFSFVMLIDHHPANNYYLKKYDWCRLYKEDTSSTKALYEYLREMELIAKEDDSYEELVQAVNDWDTWGDDNPNAKIIHDLAYNLKTTDFLNRFAMKPSMELSKRERLVLGMREEDVESVLKKVNPIFEGKTCFIFADRYVSEITLHIFETHPETDVIVIVNTTTQNVSYRSRNGKYDVSRIAAENGGNGSSKSSGNSISPDKMSRILNILLEGGMKDYTKEGK
jgi:oligoribonuclease NrnB/cAMP/cGMP phosphodiesterase (DHH superfamily)